MPSVPFLEALLLFHGQQGKPLTKRDVARRLYLSEQAVSRLLEGLLAAGFVRPDDDAAGEATFSLAPQSPELAGMLDRLAACYVPNLIEITNLIHDKTQRSAAQFADAFKLRKDR